MRDGILRKIMNKYWNAQMIQINVLTALRATILCKARCSLVWLPACYLRSPGEEQIVGSWSIHLEWRACYEKNSTPYLGPHLVKAVVQVNALNSTSLKSSSHYTTQSSVIFIVHALTNSCTHVNTHTFTHSNIRIHFATDSAQFHNSQAQVQNAPLIFYLFSFMYFNFPWLLFFHYPLLQSTFSSLRVQPWCSFKRPRIKSYAHMNIS